MMVNPSVIIRLTMGIKFTDMIGLFFFALLSISNSYGEGQNASLSDDWDVPTEAELTKNPVRYDVHSVRAGRALFEIHCLACHGYYAEGTGIVGATLDKRPANLLRLSGKQSEGAFAWKIAQGRGEMPSFMNKLSERQIWYIVNFIASLENESGSLGDANY